MEEFLSLEVTTLEWLLQQKVLNVESEMEVYYALERWLDSDIKNRLQYSKELSQYIHFEDKKTEIFLEDLVSTRSNKMCTRVGLGLIMVLNAIFNNISVISWWSVLLVGETGENHRPVTSH
jgi:hypothetical protein